MADNIELNAGTGGAVVATDEVTGSVHYQLIKPAFGGLGVATLVTGSTPLPIQGTTDFPIPITVLGGTLSAISGTVTVVGSVNTNAATGTAPISGSVSIIGGTVGVNVTGGALTGTSPISGSVSIIGGTVGANITGGSVHVQGTVTVLGTVTTTATVTMGTVPAITSTVSVVATPSDAQQQWGAGSLDLIQVGLMTPAGTVAANAGLPVSGTLAAITGTVTVVGSVTTNASVTMGTVPAVTSGSINVSNQGGSVAISGGTLSAISGTVTIVGSVTTGVTVSTGTTPVFGTVTQPVYITGSVSVPGTVTVVGSVTTSATIGTIDTILSGSVNVRNQGGSVQVSSIVGTLPDKNQNQIFRVLAGSTSIALGSVGGTGDYLSHITIVVGSTDANQVILADHTSGTFTIFGSVPGPGKTTYTVAVDAYSRFGPWRLSLGGGVNVLATGRFTN